MSDKRTCQIKFKDFGLVSDSLSYLSDWLLASSAARRVQIDQWLWSAFTACSLEAGMKWSITLITPWDHQFTGSPDPTRNLLLLHLLAENTIEAQLLLHLLSFTTEFQFSEFLKAKSSKCPNVGLQISHGNRKKSVSNEVVRHAESLSRHHNVAYVKIKWSLSKNIF